MEEKQAVQHILNGSQGLKAKGLQDIIRQNEQYSIIEITSREGVCEALETTTFDLIILDWDGNGYRAPEIIHEARKKRNSKTPVLIIVDDSQVKRAEAWSSGVDDCAVMPMPPIELQKRVKRVIQHREFEVLNAELALENVQLRELSITDGLTKLVNRRQLNERTDEKFKLFQRFKTPLSLIIVDIDHFKHVNDNFGHLAGDFILTQLARILKSSVREIDVVGRYGGEEFVLLLHETPMEGALKVAEKLRASVAGFDLSAVPTKLHLPKNITISLGVANLPVSKVARPEELFELADKALYRAKQGGRNRVEAA